VGVQGDLPLGRTARAIVRAEGGGEIQVVNRMGKIVSSDRVSRSTTRRNGKRA
jgi:hypothetical protein